ncbi:hypothetical protein J4526_05925 [Desulfurococcaceae archaeon MEX13E-LK6-19]|nr:hypothetical protein J4526_05925 [Desulfurococcaceae archaeon MEX13E-LK6-19]
MLDTSYSGNYDPLELFVYAGDDICKNPLLPVNNVSIVTERYLDKISLANTMVEFMSKIKRCKVNIMVDSPNSIKEAKFFAEKLVSNNVKDINIIITSRIVKDFSREFYQDLLRDVYSIIIYCNKFIELYNVITEVASLKTVNSRLYIINHYDPSSIDTELLMLVSRKYNVNQAIITDKKCLTYVRSIEDLVEQPLEPTKWLIYDVFLYYNKTHRIYKYILQPDGKTKTYTWKLAEQPVYTSILVHDNRLLSNINIREPLSSVLRGFLEKLVSKESLSKIGEVRVDIVLKINDDVLVDEKFVKALKLIEKYKSLKKVSQKLAVPYITLKKKIESLERSLGTQIVVIKRGGISRGETVLTSVGRDLVNVLDEVYQDLRNRLTEQLWFISSDVTRKGLLVVKFP